MKLADVTPVFKMEGRTNKKNYRPISILSNLSKFLSKFLKDPCITNFLYFLIRYFQNVNADLEKAVIKSLEQSANLLFNWFKCNQMKGNKDKYHVLLSTDETVQVNIGTARINDSKCEKLVGIKIDCKLSFDDHIGNICKKAGTKLNALTRVAQCMNTEKSA